MAGPDPTRPLVYTPQSQIATSGAIRLESILVSQKRRLAVINGAVVGVGEKVKGFQVKSIDDQQVKVERNGRVTVLRLPRTQVKKEAAAQSVSP